MTSPPNFWALFADAISVSAAKRSIFAFLPWWLLTCLLVPVIGVYEAGPYLKTSILESSSTTILSAVAVVGGFFGSVSIATMGQVQRMASEYPFSSYLREEKVFDLFLFWPQFTLLTQICLILFSTLAAALIRIVELDFFAKYIIAADLGLLIYVCTKTWHLIELIRKLTWHYEDYQRQSAEYLRGQKDGSENTGP